MTHSVVAKRHTHERYEGYGRRVAPATGELLAAVSSSLGQTIGRMVAGMGEAAGATARRRRHDHDECDGCHGHHDHEHDHDGCDDCHGDRDHDCRCRCCVGDADLLVYARFGERRVVPISLENRRRREREVQVSLSSFTTSGGKQAGVQGRLLPPTDFTLDPCADREVTLLLAAAEADLEREEKDREEKDREEKLPDVDECEVAYADLRVVGCDVRPVRIAVAVLPRDCASYSVACGCGCC
jgi:hypothetical protein